MLELNTSYPDKEDIELAKERCFASIRDSITDLELLFKRIIEGNIYLDDEETAKLLHCKKNEIPQRLVRYRASRVGYLYKLSEIYEFINSKRIGGN